MIWKDPKDEKSETREDVSTCWERIEKTCSKIIAIKMACAFLPENAEMSK